MGRSSTSSLEISAAHCFTLMHHFFCFSSLWNPNYLQRKWWGLDLHLSAGMKGDTSVVVSLQFHRWFGSKSVRNMADLFPLPARLQSRIAGSMESLNEHRECFSFPLLSIMGMYIIYSILYYGLPTSWSLYNLTCHLNWSFSAVNSTLTSIYTL